MLVGCMRVSSADDRQSVDLHRVALVAAGVHERHLYRDRAPGARDDRPGLKACLEHLKAGDTLGHGRGTPAVSGMGGAAEDAPQTVGEAHARRPA